VNERWVCKRCFADNQETDAACTRCGLVRGAESPEADRQQWASEDQERAFQRAERPAWQRWLRFAWIPIIGVVVLIGFLSAAPRGGDGSLTGSGTVNVDDLREGDCFNTGDETEISDVDGVPCDEPHGYEVYAIVQHEADAFPTDAEMDQVFTSRCEGPFESYVGAPYATSAIYASMITPSEESWADGDRNFICVLYDPDDEALTESLRDAAR
jgi:hypothetical protein